MKNVLLRVITLVIVLSLLAACTAPKNDSTPAAGPASAQATATTAVAEPAVLNVMTHDSFAVTEDLIRVFEQENNVKVNFIKSGDTGAALNRAILSKGAPLADVFYGVDNTFLSRALEEEIFEAYDAPALADIADEFKLDDQNRALPVNYGDVCINYDTAYFAEKNLKVPQNLKDLVRPEYKGLLVVESPATSSPGLAFLLASIAQFGEEGYLDFWADLRENGVVVVNDWETAYYTNFSGSSGKGPQPMAVSYGSSPVAEMVFAETTPSEPPTASVVGPNTCFRQIEFVGILQGTQQRALAEKFIDFMLGPAFQEDVPMQMFVYPVNQKAVLPEPFQKYAQFPEQPAALDPAEIAANREKWIQAWDDTVLR